MALQQLIDRKNAVLQTYNTLRATSKLDPILQDLAIQLATLELELVAKVKEAEQDYRPNLVSSFSLLADALRIAGMDPQSLLESH